MTNLRRAGELFGHVMPDVRAALDELPRRERCHRLFLRYLGHGGGERLRPDRTDGRL